MGGRFTQAGWGGVIGGARAALQHALGPMRDAPGHLFCSRTGEIGFLAYSNTLFPGPPNQPLRKIIAGIDGRFSIRHERCGEPFKAAAIKTELFHQRVNDRCLTSVAQGR